MKNKLLLFSIFLLSVLCGGCWENNEISQQAIVLAMGIDSAPKDKLQVSVQIPIAEKNLSPLAGGEAESRKSFYVISKEADSVFSSITGLQGNTSKDIFYGQLKVLVINTEIAQRGILEVIDLVQRHPEIPPQMVIVLTKGKAADILKAELSSNEVPAFAIHDSLLSPDKYDAVYSLRVWQIARSIINGSEDVFIPFIYFDQQEKALTIQGLGVFHQGRLAGELSDIETRMFGLMTGRARNAHPSLSFGNKGWGTFRNVSACSQVRIEFNDAPIRNQPLTFLVKVHAQGLLVELTSGKAQLNIKEINNMQKKIEGALRNQMIETLRHLQQLNADILGFGELLRAERPKIWSHLNWEEEYPRIRVKVAVKFQIERTGEYR